MVDQSVRDRLFDLIFELEDAIKMQTLAILDKDLHEVDRWSWKKILLEFEITKLL